MPAVKRVQEAREAGDRPGYYRAIGDLAQIVGVAAGTGKTIAGLRPPLAEAPTVPPIARALAPLTTEAVKQSTTEVTSAIPKRSAEALPVGETPKDSPAVERQVRGAETPAVSQEQPGQPAPAEARPETALTPAIRVQGKIFTGSNHLQAEAAAKSGGQPDLTGMEEGFVGPDGRFIGREEAARVSGLPTATEPGKLHSTDLPSVVEIEPLMGLRQFRVTREFVNPVDKGVYPMGSIVHVPQLEKSGIAVPEPPKPAPEPAAPPAEPAAKSTLEVLRKRRAELVTEVDAEMKAAKITREEAERQGHPELEGQVPFSATQTKARRELEEINAQLPPSDFAKPSPEPTVAPISPETKAENASRFREAMSPQVSQELVDELRKDGWTVSGVSAHGKLFDHFEVYYRGRKVSEADTAAAAWQKVMDGQITSTPEEVDAIRGQQVALATQFKNKYGSEWSGKDLSPQELAKWKASTKMAPPPVAPAEAPKFSDWLRKLMERESKRLISESEGAGILIDAENAGRTPDQIAREFFENVYPTLPDAQRAKLDAFFKANTGGMAPGDIIGTKAGPGDTRLPLKAESWMDIIPGSLQANTIEQLQGTERGLIAVMEYGNEAAKHKVTVRPTETKALPALAEAEILSKLPVKPQKSATTIITEQTGRLAEISRELGEIDTETRRLVRKDKSAFDAAMEAGRDYKTPPEVQAQLDKLDERRNELLREHAPLVEKHHEEQRQRFGEQVPPESTQKLLPAPVEAPKPIQEVTSLAEFHDPISTGALLGAFQRAHARGEVGLEAQKTAWSLYAAGKEAQGGIANLTDWLAKTKRIEELLRPEAPKPKEPPATPAAEFGLEPDQLAEAGEPLDVAQQKQFQADISKEPHGLPEGVSPGSLTFPHELMEASRRLGALARSKVTLPEGTVGALARTKEGDKIYMGDIRNQRTMAHEIGHELDTIIFAKGALGHSQRSLVERLGTGTKKALFNELKGVSELMRGPVASAYRKRASELIADFFSLYAHDPARARAMAPDFARGFEKALERHPETKEIVDQLLAGEVKPEAPERLTSTVTMEAGKLPGKVLARPEVPAVAREREAAIAAEGLVKEAVRMLEAKVQGARVLTDKWRETVPNAGERNDVGAFVEGIGNLERQGDDIGAVKARMTPKMERLAKEYRFRQELQRQEINQYLKGTEDGEYLKFLEDYLGHFYADPITKLRGALSRFLKESPHAKQRKLPTLKEAVDLGLKPITQDPAITYELTSRINWRVATNRKVIGELKNLKTTSGEPVIVPAKDAPPGWEISNNPLIQRVYARQAGGATLLWKGGAAIHPDVWRSVRQILDTPTSTGVGKAYDALNSITRANAFAFSGFHDLSLRFAALGSAFRLSNPARGLARIMERHPVTGERELFRFSRGVGKELLKSEEAVTDAAMHGLKFAWTDSEAYQHAARDTLDKLAARWRDVPYLGKSIALVRDLQNLRQKGLWKNTHDAFKILAYHDIVGKSLQDSPAGVSPKLIKEQVASLLNDAFGGQEWQTKFWLEPKVRQAYSRFFLAPDWTLSTIRSVPLASDIATTARTQLPRVFGKEELPGLYEGIGNVRRLKFWGAELAAIATATIAAQYAINKMFGDSEKGDKEFPWENEYNSRNRVDVTPIMRQMPWHDPKDKTRRYVNLGKRPAEILRWFSNPMEQLESKAARPVAELVKQIAGMEGSFQAEWKRDHESFIESLPARGKSVAKEFLPFSFSGSQFVLSLPMAKGMTKYKAQQAFQSVYEVAAEPSRVKAILRGQPFAEGDLKSMVSQISDAAERNGVNSEEVRRRSISIVRGHHYDLFFKAMQKGDQESMTHEEEALSRIGATHRGLQESIQRKQKLLQP